MSGSMTRDDFRLGVKILLSCGGPDVDKETLEVWFRMLRGFTGQEFSKAVTDLCQTEKYLHKINIVAEISSRCLRYRRATKLAHKPQKSLPLNNQRIEKQELKNLLAEFNASLSNKIQPYQPLPRSRRHLQHPSSRPESQNKTISLESAQESIEA